MNQGEGVEGLRRGPAAGVAQEVRPDEAVGRDQRAHLAGAVLAGDIGLDLRAQLARQQSGEVPDFGGMAGADRVDHLVQNHGSVVGAES